MTMVYGPFLLSHIPSDAVETEAQKLALLDQFANIDMAYCSKFREVIDEKVVEFRDNPDGVAPDISYGWLEGEEAVAVLSVQNKRGWVPASYFQFLDGYGNLFVPYGMEVFGEYHLNLSTGGKFDFYCVSAALVIQWINQRSEELRQRAQKSPEWAANCCSPDSLDDILEFHNQLVSAIEACMKAGVIFIIGS